MVARGLLLMIAWFMPVLTPIIVFLQCVWSHLYTHIRTCIHIHTCEEKQGFLRHQKSVQRNVFVCVRSSLCQNVIVHEKTEMRRATCSCSLEHSRKVNSFSRSDINFRVIQHLPDHSEHLGSHISWLPECSTNKKKNVTYVLNCQDRGNFAND